MEARPWASPRAATTIFVNPFYEVAEVPRSEFGTRVTRGERVRDEETSFLRTILRFRAGGWNEDDGSSKRSSSFESDRPSLIKRTAGDSIRFCRVSSGYLVDRGRRAYCLA